MVIYIYFLDLEILEVWLWGVVFDKVRERKILLKKKWARVIQKNKKLGVARSIKFKKPSSKIKNRLDLKCVASKNKNEG